METGRLLRILAAAATAVLAVALVLVLSQSSHHRTGSNGAPPVTQVALPAGGELCQGGEFVPPETGRITLHPADAGGVVGPLTVTATTSDGELLGRGRVAPRDYGSEASVATEFEPVETGTLEAVVCIRNEGGVDGALRGDSHPAQAGAALLTGGPNPGPSPYVRMRFDYEFPEASSWWSFAPEIAERFGLVKATFFGSWTLWVTVAALLALALATIWYAARALAR